jgi:tetrahydromethanopterin S-methyltransferase subunit B
MKKISERPSLNAVLDRIAKLETSVAVLKTDMDWVKERLNHIESRLDRIESRIDSLLKWTVGLIMGMWITVMMTLLPILLKLLGAI